jgi:hypothetical protein
MKHLSRILPVAAVLAAMGGAIYYVHAQAAYRPPVVEVKQAAPSAPASLVPPSDRYANNSAAN